VLTSEALEKGLSVLKAGDCREPACCDDRREEQMPDVTLVVRDLADAEDAERLERALGRLSFVSLVNVDREKGLVAVSFEGESRS
jgi:hypothetical protein